MLESTHDGVNIGISKTTIIRDFDICDTDDASLVNGRAKDFFRNASSRKLEQNFEARQVAEMAGNVQKLRDQ